ncbi:ran-specific GTPase-activating protein 30 [Monosporozyma unispora]
MDEFLSKAGSQAVSFAIKSGVSIASSFAIKKISNFIVQIPHEDATKLELLRTQLETRIEIVSSALDLIKLVAARGNTNLGYTLNLTQGLRKDIDEFDNKVSELFKDIEDSSTNSKKQAVKIQSLEVYMTNLLKQIENVTPFINLSLTTSGANLNSTLSKNISPSLLLNASNHVIESNKDVSAISAVGPTFEVTLYTIFYNSSNADNPITWKETMKRASIIINRVRSKDSNKYDYTINIKQNLDDGRYHNEEETDNIRDLTLHVEKIKRLVFNVSGKLLRLEENDNPVLILKTESEYKSSDINWYAFGSYDAPDLSESEEEDEEEDTTSENSEEEFKDASETSNSPEVSTSVSLLEYILRLISLQHDDGKSILNITDERLSFYLNDENAHIKTKEKHLNIQEVINALKNMNLE